MARRRLEQRQPFMITTREGETCMRSPLVRQVVCMCNAYVEMCLCIHIPYMYPDIYIHISANVHNDNYN
jgi:hypothetical protein